MDENIKVFTITVPGSPPESAKEFIRSLVTPTQDPEGNLSPPPRITFDHESGLSSVYIIGDLTFRSVGLNADGSPLGTVIKAVVMRVEHGRWTAPAGTDRGRLAELEGRRNEDPGAVPPISEYPREVVCLNCEEVVAYATINVIPQSPMLAAELIRPDGSYPEACDPGCLNCSPGGPFRLRDRVTGEWIGEPPPDEEEPSDER